jgi:hypothetical protein
VLDQPVYARSGPGHSGAVSLALAAVAAVLPAAPAHATDYYGVTESTFSCWEAPVSGNSYCATIRSSVAFDINDGVAYRVNIWCTVNGNPSNCQITWTGGLKRWRSDLGPAYATYPWGTATNQTGGGSSQVIWQGGWHSPYKGAAHYVFSTVGSVNVRWTAPNQLSSTKTRCSEDVLIETSDEIQQAHDQVASKIWSSRAKAAANEVQA